MGRARRPDSGYGAIAHRGAAWRPLWTRHEIAERVDAGDVIGKSAASRWWRASPACSCPRRAWRAHRAGGMLAEVDGATNPRAVSGSPSKRGRSRIALPLPCAGLTLSRAADPAPHAVRHRLAIVGRAPGTGNLICSTAFGFTAYAPSRMPVDYLQKILTAKVYDVAIETPLELAASLSRAARQPRAAEARGPAAGVLVQAARRLQQDGAAARGRARAGCHRRIGRQPRAGCGARRAAARLQTRRSSCRSPRRTSRSRRSRRAARTSCCTAIRTRTRMRRRCELQKATRRDVRASVRRSRRHRRPGHDRHGDPAPVPGTARRDLRRRRRRRPDRRHRRVREARAAGGQVIGVQPVDSDAMARSLAAGRRVMLPHVGLFADGVAVKQVGKETFRLAPPVRRRHDPRRHRRDLRRDQGRVRGHARRSSSRPARSPSPASRLVRRHRVRDRTFVAIACGANMNFDRLRFVAERAELGEQREAILAVTIPERPGSFREFCALLGKRSVTEFNYRYADPQRRAPLRRHRSRESRARPPQLLAALRARHDRGLRPVRQRDGEAARAPPGRRPCAGGRERDPLPLRVSRAARRADAVPGQHERRLEHQPVPLPQPRRRLRARAGRHAGAARARTPSSAVSSTAWATTTSTRRPIRPTGCSSAR